MIAPDGDVLRGAHLVYGGVREEARGILSTKREVKELRDRAASLREALNRLAGQTADLAASIDRLSQEIAGLVGEAHAQEKAIVGFEALVAKANENRDRLARKSDLLGTESARAQEERRALEARENEARASVVRQEEARLAADERLAAAQHQFQEARGAVEVITRRVADAGAAHAGLVERATGLLTEVARQGDAISELEARFTARQEEARQNHQHQADLRQSIEDGKRQLDLDVHELDRLRGDMHEADERLASLRQEGDVEDGEIRD